MIKNIFIMSFIALISFISLTGCCCSNQNIENAINDMSGYLATHYFNETEINIKDIISKNPDIKAKDVVNILVNEKKNVSDEVSYSTRPGEEVLMLEVENPESIKMSYYYESKLFKSKTISIK